MTKRLQVMFDDEELSELRRIAKGRKMTLAEWVRQTLCAAQRQEPLGDASRKLDVIRRASRHEFPTAEIETMVEETERGYLERPSR
jgi:hypothetical protein